MTKKEKRSPLFLFLPFFLFNLCSLSKQIAIIKKIRHFLSPSFSQAIQRWWWWWAVVVEGNGSVASKEEENPKRGEKVIFFGGEGGGEPKEEWKTFSPLSSRLGRRGGLGGLGRCLADLGRGHRRRAVGREDGERHDRGGDAARDDEGEDLRVFFKGFFFR